MTTVVLAPDPMTTTCTALRWEWRSNGDLAEHYLRQLSDAERAEARMVLLRLALRIDAMTPEGVAAALLAPDSLPLPAGVDGYAISGRTS